MKNLRRIREHGYKDALKDVEKLLDICKVCGSSHGKWLDRDDFYKKLKELRHSLSKKTSLNNACANSGEGQ